MLITAPTCNSESLSNLDWYQRVQVVTSPGIRLERLSGKWKLIFNNKEVTFNLPEGTVTDIFSHLADGGCPLKDLAHAIQSDRSDFLQKQIHRLWSEGHISQVLIGEDGVAASFTSVGASSFLPSFPDLSQGYSWSSTAYIRAVSSWVMLETAESGATIALNPHYKSLVNFVVQCAELCTPGTSLFVSTQDETLMLTAWLLDSGFLKRTDIGYEENQAGLCFADKLIHARSRRGRHLGGYGATHRMDGCLRSAPAVPPPASGEKITLPKPDLDALCRNDPPFAAVVEGRRSARFHGEKPIDRRALGEFLYRVARVRQIQNGGDYEVAIRPYPSGGALYSVDIYVLVNLCLDIPKGLYRYDGVYHQLEKISNFNQDAQRLLDESVSTSGATTEPNTLLVLAARFHRVTWKYESITYALILKEVGVIYQTMYLVATAMNLAACALGGGSASLFGKLSGKAFWEESSVGEFLLGAQR